MATCNGRNMSTDESLRFHFEQGEELLEELASSQIEVTGPTGLVGDPQ